MSAARRFLHRHGIHRFCRVITVTKRPVIGHDFGEKWLVGEDRNGTPVRVNATVFGGEPVYGEPVTREEHSW